MSIQELYEIYKQYPNVQTDTRKLKQGDLFFALKGPNFNGNKFAQKALDEGAAYAIVDEEEYNTSDNTILVEDSLITLQQLAKHHRQQFDIPFIAITGSNGKTTTKELVATTLATTYKTYATKGNLNNHIGVPLTLLSIPLDAEMAIIEMGANHQKEIASYCDVALPNHGIITNCGKAHLEGFGGIEGVRKGKGELYDYIADNNGIIFRNVDLDYLTTMASKVTKQVTYGLANADYIGKPLNDDVFLKVAILNKDNEGTIYSQLVGAYNYNNIMTAVAVGLHFNISIDVIKKAIETYAPDNSRSQLTNIGTNKVISDAYNANPTSMRAAIKNLLESELSNKTLWLGAMKEMGNEEAQEHKDLVTYIDQYEWQQVILVGHEFEGYNGKHLLFEDATQAATHIKANPPQNSSILIKGSRGSKMEIMQQALQDINAQ